MPPRRVLVAEDEVLVGMMLEDLLSSLGVEISALAGTVPEALAEATKGGFDCAILDVHLHGKNILPVVEMLEQRGIPFIFATGYGKAGLPEKYRSAPVLPKPFTAEELSRILSSVGISASPPS